MGGCEHSKTSSRRKYNTDDVTASEADRRIADELVAKACANMDDTLESDMGQVKVIVERARDRLDKCINEGKNPYETLMEVGEGLHGESVQWLSTLDAKERKWIVNVEAVLESCMARERDARLAKRIARKMFDEIWDEVELAILSGERGRELGRRMGDYIGRRWLNKLESDDEEYGAVEGMARWIGWEVWSEDV